jgi:hypothetical protein
MALLLQEHRSHHQKKKAIIGVKERPFSFRSTENTT